MGTSLTVAVSCRITPPLCSPVSRAALFFYGLNSGSFANKGAPDMGLCGNGGRILAWWLRPYCKVAQALVVRRMALADTQTSPDL